MESQTYSPTYDKLKFVAQRPKIKDLQFPYKTSTWQRSYQFPHFERQQRRR